MGPTKMQEGASVFAQEQLLVVDLLGLVEIRTENGAPVHWLALESSRTLDDPTTCGTKEALVPAINRTEPNQTVGELANVVIVVVVDLNSVLGQARQGKAKGFLGKSNEVNVRLCYFYG